MRIYVVHNFNCLLQLLHGEKPTDTSLDFRITDSNTVERPTDTNLEFWITEDITNFYFSEYEEIPGGFGCTAYYGKGYHSIILEAEPEPINRIVAPEKYVRYGVSN